MKEPSTRAVAAVIPYPAPESFTSTVHPELGPDTAAAIYDAMVMHMDTALDQSQAAAAVYVQDPAGASSASRLLGREVSPLPESGAAGVFADAFASGAERAVVLFGLMPDYPLELLDKTLDDLTAAHAALGSAPDRSCNLAGFAKHFFSPAYGPYLQPGHRGGYDALYQRLVAEELEIVALPEWSPVKSIWELNDLYRQNKRSRFHKTRAWGMLREHDRILKQYDMDKPTREGFSWSWAHPPTEQPQR